METVKLLRETIRKLILESINTSKYESLASMLDSYDVEAVQPAIEMIRFAPDPNANGEPYAELVSHTIHRGNSPMAQLNVRHSSISDQGTVGTSAQREDACYHMFKLKLNPSFLEYMKKIDPVSMFLQNAGEPTMIFAENQNEKWSDVSAKYNAKNSDYQITVPM